jgi:chromosome segregation ATPase
MFYYTTYNKIQSGVKIMATTEERIIEVTEKLEAEGVNPTQVTVREALGGGSFATIGPILKAWKDSKKEDNALTEIQVPEAITERLEQLQGAVWQAAVDEAERRLNAEREALKAAQEQAATEVVEHIEIIKALEVEAEEYQRKIELQDEVANSLDVARHNAQTELATLRDEHKAAAHAALNEIAESAIRADTANERAERAEALHREAVEQARSDLAALRAEHKAELAEVKKEAAEQVKKANELAQVQTSRAEKAEREAQQRGAGEQACQSRLEAAQREIEQAKKRMAKLEEKTEKATQEAAELRGELRALRESQESKNDD